MSNKTEKDKWRFAVDRGGTFTDVIGVDPAGTYHTVKLLSSSSAYGDACIEGIRRVLGIASGPLQAEKISSIRFGTTAATNALLERKGGRVALFISRGFADLLDIGYQSRPDIFSLCPVKPAHLYSSVFEVDERIGPDGSVEEGLDPERLIDDIAKIRDMVDAVAVVLMHSWKNPVHELLCEEVLKSHGVDNVFLSHKTVNLIKIVTRGQSTMVDAYLSPVMAKYMEEIRGDTAGIPIEFIKSSGGLAPPESFTGKEAVFSGPAGGVIAVGRVAVEAGLRGAIGFDMGGTSTDVSRYDGRFEKVYEEAVDGVELQGESLDINTVASGGGSILLFDGQRMRVGPGSAGAIPGPACYGLGGPLTVTDANLFTGRVLKGFFPETFGPDGRSPVDEDVVGEKFRELTDEINRGTGNRLTPEETALGFLDIANEKMALAIKEISVSRGFDVRRYAIVSFGGAGGQHACRIAERLGIEKVLFHPLASLMSAYGIGIARTTKKATKTVLACYTREVHERLREEFRGMERETVPGHWEGESRGRKEVDLRPLGADTYITVEFTDYEATLVRFKEQYRGLFGFFPDDRPVEAVNLRFEVEKTGEYFPGYCVATRDAVSVTPIAFSEVIYPGGKVRAPVYGRTGLPASFTVRGPALITDEHSTLVLDPGFEAITGSDGVITARKVPEVKGAEVPEGAGGKKASAGPDPILLEVFNNLFQSVASEMGSTLRNTAHSVNIKERLDFSCAVFDTEGDLVANAQHIPVHLGAMADTVKAIKEDKGKSMRGGDVYISNNPYRGGSHLPDVTVVEPVFSKEGKLRFFVAARGHHADIGGKTPGSLPPEVRHIEEEGVLLDGALIVRDGRFMEEELRLMLTRHRYPARNIDERVSDIRAELSACAKGVKELNALMERYGWETVSRYMGFVQDNAEFAVKKALARFLGKGNVFKADFTDALDDGTKIRAIVTITGGEAPPMTLRAIVDFTGTGPEHREDNLNAPLPVTRSAVLYVLRVLIDEDIPLNSGCLKPVEVIVPEGSILNPVYPSPVGSGNVETSQRVVDALIGALGVAAASQGTMNNLLFEVEGEPTYYETIAGGAGAVDGCSGASGVQVHMTNTRITDPEVLEVRHPGVRLDRFCLRKGSGGEGLFRGGDGVEREIRFLKPAEVSIISERRCLAPYGLKGGSSGSRGENLLKGVDGKETALGHRAFVRVEAGSSIVIKTPGGGGYGEIIDLSRTGVK